MELCAEIRTPAAWPREDMAAATVFLYVHDNTDWINDMNVQGWSSNKKLFGCKIIISEYKYKRNNIDLYKISEE